ncbi:MAG: serine/threonine-protein kinase [Myxococcota bacterium]|nr:serine/threonine-protein kinase [Myxococcota bacterium]
MSTAHPTLADGRYNIQRLIGSGGMAAVFLVEDTVLQIDRAIKVLNPALVVRPQSRTRFMTEAIAMARLDHPSIVRVFDHGQEGLTSYIVMEYLAHGSLQRYRHSMGCLPREVALSLCVDVAEALAHAHSSGIIHRDVKPDNILLSPAGARLTDFGLARLSEGVVNHTRTRAMLGTPSFMPPEQRLNAKMAGPQSDLYALTATLFCLLVDADPIDLYDNAVQSTCLETLDPDLAALIRRGCHADLDQRFASAEALIEALEMLRDVPYGRRSLPDLTGYTPNASTVDMDELHHVWASYTGRSSEPDARLHSVDAMSRTLSLLPIEQPSEPPSPSPESPEPPAAAAPEPSRLRWGILSITLLAVLLWLVSGRPSPPFFSDADSLAQTAEDASPIQRSIEALLAGDPGPLLQSRLELPADSAAAPAVYSLYTAQRILLDSPPYGVSSSPEAHRLDLGVPLEAALLLAEQSWDPDSPPDPEDWRDIRGDDPMIEVLFLLSMQLSPDQNRQRRALQGARARFPEHAIFAYLELSQRRTADGYAADDEGLMVDLSSALGTFSEAPLLMLERGRALFAQGELGAATELLSLALKRTPELVQAHSILADIYATQDQEAMRIEQLLMSTSDALAPAEQQRMLSEHGLTMASIGQLTEAQKLWQFCHTLIDATMNGAERLDCTMQALSAMVRLGETQTSFFEEQRDQAMAHLARAPAGSHYHRRAACTLVFSEGMAALQAGQTVLAQQHLAQLQLLEHDDFRLNPQHLSMQLMAEMVLAGQADDPEALQAARARLDALTTPRCALVLLSARVADAQGDSGAVDAQLQRIVERQCRQDRSPLLTRTSAQLWQAERAHAAGRRDDAVQAFHAASEAWKGADESLELKQRMLQFADVLDVHE